MRGPFCQWTEWVDNPGKTCYNDHGKEGQDTRVAA